MLKIQSIKVLVDKKYTDIELTEIALKKICKKYGINSKQINSIKLFKKSIDARKEVVYDLTFLIDVNKNIENKLLKKDKLISRYKSDDITFSKTSNPKNILVVGAGPSGLFASYILSIMGHKVTLIEQGEKVEDRINTVNNFWLKNKLNPKSNVQFGEGGAGTFSDGKLNTSVNTIYNRFVLETFVKFGAPKNILVDSKPHIGTDILVKLLINFRKELENNNVDILFNHQLIDICENTNVKILNLKDNIIINSQYDKVILAIGHSAKDTYHMLKNKLKLEPKPFSIGVRIEHPQKLINESLYKESNIFLPPANYKLVKHLNNGRTVYSFCMCPGGEVVCAKSEDSNVVVNGMSNSKRDSKFANSALLVNVNVDDYYVNDPLDGLYFQEKYEKITNDIANGFVPIQKLKDFKTNTVSNLDEISHSMKYKVVPRDINKCLPKFVTDALKEAIVLFDKDIKGFDYDDATLFGIESRSSSPIRIVRNENFESTTKNIYPIGEGAGYAGGIITSAIDGIKVALKIDES